MFAFNEMNHGARKGAVPTPWFMCEVVPSQGPLLVDCDMMVRRVTERNIEYSNMEGGNEERREGDG